uniref:Uncharacterized protein n=1 Tax=Brassica campestris TaxID=3711 RepID=A0A3P5Z8D4_BRACM|nr:unnamed protein product [Brassica rapa]
MHPASVTSSPRTNVSHLYYGVNLQQMLLMIFRFVVNIH